MIELYNILKNGLLSFTLTNPAPELFTTRPGTDFNSILGFALNFLLSIAGAVSVIFVIIAGFQYVSARGNEQQAEAAKKSLFNAVIGFAVITMAWVILYVVQRALTTGYV